MGVNYSAVRTTSNIDGTPAQEILNLYDLKSDKKFGNTGKGAQGGQAFIVDCNCPMSYEDRILIEPRLSELLFSEEDRPTYLPSGCQNMSNAVASAIVATHGPVGTAYAKEIRIG